MVEYWHSGTVRNIPFLRLERETPPPGPERKQDGPGGGEGGYGAGAFILVYKDLYFKIKKIFPELYWECPITFWTMEMRLKNCGRFS